ncbi:unnamed protein product [Spirodela intermedia]|uniref:Uncharacterized protein n=1 Tax=Spirodela intermedia TaxID=51605 RepID=A0A7I8JBU6_SPIIN|nr:unnamed protein product [Spirodela intermedia]CAA6666953.1 unnamed protein product [Spirodela intermedia]
MFIHFSENGLASTNHLLCLRRSPPVWWPSSLLTEASGKVASPCFSQSYLHISSLLQSFVNRKAIEPGKQLHAHLIVSGLGCDAVLATKLVNLYSVSHSLAYAQALFDIIPKGNIFLWNVLIRGYAWDGPHERAVELFQQMLDSGLEPDNFTFQVGRCIHDRVMRSRWQTDVFVGAGLIDMFAKCGYVSEAQEVFDRMPARDAVLWNSMIAAYAHNAYPLRALALCRGMVFNSFKPTEATLVTAISASADASALPKGREIHGFSWRVGFHTHDKVKTALIDMYAKGGWVRAAKTLFDQLTEKRVVSWNAMISGYSMHGYAYEALELFERMKEEGRSKWLVPDHITFVGVLSACRHGGLLELGWDLFNSMAKDYSITPTIQHYTCMIDLLGHSGSLEKAYDLIGKMPIRPDSGVWGSLLNACKIHRNVALGEVALQKLIELEPDDAGTTSSCLTSTPLPGTGKEPPG